MNDRVFDPIETSISSAFEANSSVKGVLLRALSNLNEVKLSGSLSFSAIKLHAVCGQNASTPFVTIIVADNLDVSGEETNFASSVNAVVFRCSSLFLTEMVEVEGFSQSDDTSYDVV